jgi:hypothetical protein
MAIKFLLTGGRTHTRYTQRPHEPEQLQKDQNIKKYNFTYCFNAPGVQPFMSNGVHTLDF